MALPPTPPVIKFEISASAVAWYGAIVATLAFLINAISVVHRILQDRFDVSLSIKPGMIVMPHGLYPHDKDEIFTSFNIVNKGTRSVVITSAGFQMDGKKAGKYSSAVIMAFGQAGELPKEIKGGDRHSVLAVQSHIMEKLDIIKYFEVSSATGKVFKRRMTSKLKQQFLDSVKKDGSKEI